MHLGDQHWRSCNQLAVRENTSSPRMRAIAHQTKYQRQNLIASKYTTAALTRKTAGGVDS